MLKENIAKILTEIKNGNNLGEKITLVGATKFVSVEKINEAITYGLTTVAENKVQEFREKTDKIIGAEQHFIGHLQTNKVKHIVGKVQLIHSVHSIKLLETISKIATEKKIIQNVLLEVNISKEPSKSGFFEDEIETAFYYANKLSGVSVKGFMAMFPKTENKNLIIDLCEKMRGYYDGFIKEGFSLSYLSMGMSEDYLTAIKHGSNLIRIGSKIFGERIKGDTYGII